MTQDQRIAALEQRLEALQDDFTAYALGREQVFADVEELFQELGKAMSLVAASLEDLSDEDEPALYADGTGVMGRAFELQALLGIFRDNVFDLQQRLRSMRRSPRRARRAGLAAR